ncbi:hypothetical protein HanOQP8_Chr17g0664651 [Helianthus annuus]|nr:hypothetical protein HanIR_Chr17g0877551 [Helianthus annuus]KAJ0636669.1 hypothetical protein HanOQP8_Chr17g0664651 [Helianthus annuus]
MVLALFVLFYGVMTCEKCDLLLFVLLYGVISCYIVGVQYVGRSLYFGFCKFVMVLMV